MFPLIHLLKFSFNLSSSSTDQVSIYWTKRDSNGNQLESTKIDIKYNPDDDVFTYGTFENSATGSKYTEITSSQGQQARYDLMERISSNSSVFNNEDYINYLPVFTSPASFSAEENQTAIGTVTATDADDEEVTFTISGDELAIHQLEF